MGVLGLLGVLGLPGLVAVSVEGAAVTVRPGTLHYLAIARHCAGATLSLTDYGYTRKLQPKRT